MPDKVFGLCEVRSIWANAMSRKARVNRSSENLFKKNSVNFFANSPKLILGRLFICSSTIVLTFSINSSFFAFLSNFLIIFSKLSLETCAFNSSFRFRVVVNMMTSLNPIQYESLPFEGFDNFLRSKRRELRHGSLQSRCILRLLLQLVSLRHAFLSSLCIAR